MRTLRYVLVDVFTDRPLAGNQLAVFTDARGLPDETLQQLAREMNLSETVFVFSASTRDAEARIRIFTPTRELPFAGHPTLGSAFVLGGPLQRELLRLETGVGIIPVLLVREGARIVFGWMKQPLPTIAPFGKTQELLAALGVNDSTLPVELYSNGPQHLFVELPDPAAVAHLRPDMNRLAQLVDAGVSTFARTETGWKTRVFAPAHGVPEDAATGSAAGPLALHLCRHGRAAFGQEIQIEQGAEIGRPSRLFARIHGDVHTVTAVEVGGSAVVLGRGEIQLP